MDSRLHSVFNFATLLILTTITSSLSAEIYQCRDDNGRATFSNKPCPVEEVVGDSDAHVLWREMRLLVGEGLKISSNMGADVSAIIKCNRTAKAYAEHLDLIDRRLAELRSSKHKHLFSAQHSLRECGQCRASAPRSCQQASKHLDLQMRVFLPQLRSASN